MRLSAVAAAVVCAVALICAAGAGAEVEVLYFYQSYCESCDPEADFAESFRSFTGLRPEEYELNAYNVVKKSGKSAFDEAAKKYAITDNSFPMAVVNGVIYVGEAQMSSRLPSDSLKWGTNADSVIICLYAPSCENCERARKVIDALAEYVTVRRGDISIESRVDVRYVDASLNASVAYELYESFNVPDEKRVTPCVFLSDAYLSGIESIEKNLADMVNLGWASGGKLSKALGGVPARARSSIFLTDVASAAAAGIAAGFNTCALSMLMLFMSLVIGLKRKAGLITACFLASKFACYLLIGFLLLGLFQKVNPSFFKPAALTIMTVIGTAIAMVNIYDAFQARKGMYGSVVNQLPSGLRGRLNRVIRVMTGKRLMIISSVVLGFIVACGEFLCAGQFYLMRLLQTARTGSGGTLALLIYCLCFIAPSCVLAAVLLRGGSQARASRFFLRHMAAVKAASAIVMLGLIAAAWLI